jgi:TP901 family phage tail tape measure protein
MANVGMRLLLPPRSEFNKAASGFGGMVSKIQSYQKRYFSTASTQNVNSLRKTLRQTGQLAKKAAKDSSATTMSSLNKSLRGITAITKSSIGQTAKSFGITRGAAAGVQKQIRKMNFQKVGGERGATFAKRYAKDLKQLQLYMADVQRQAERMAMATAQGVRELENMGNQMLGQFRQALTVSISLLTTIGYSIRGLAQDFATFEGQIINANSIWQEQNDILYSISDQVLKFGEKYGVAYDNASKVLYQFASAGLEAAEAQAVLNDVLILSMAVQGDANTIGKLTVQTIKGFGLEMSDAGMVTDKFAHSINASLIEYQDLASAIKFALPFYAATNQSLDQLLGSIQILTDRALEAGIAGRGLRQALAEFAQGAEDSTRKFAKMGVEVVDAQGNFLQLTEIARNFSNQIGKELANDTELLTSLIEDLNIRGATAFIHLVQNVDEFEQAVAELANSQGAANEMALIQQGSLVMQIQLLRNAAKEVFFLSEEQYVANGYMNEFDFRLKSLVQSFTTMFITELPDGTKELTEFSYQLRNTVMVTLEGFESVMNDLVKTLISMTEEGYGLADMAKTLFYPLNIIASTMMLMDRVLGGIGQEGLILKFYTLSMMFGKFGAFAIMASQSIQSLLSSLEELGDAMGILLMLASIIPIFSGARMAVFGARGTMGAAKMGTKGRVGGSKMWGARDVTKNPEFKAGKADITSKYAGMKMSKRFDTPGAPTMQEFLTSREAVSQNIAWRRAGFGPPQNQVSKAGQRHRFAGYAERNRNLDNYMTQADNERLYKNTYPGYSMKTQAFRDKRIELHNYTDKYVQGRGRGRLMHGAMMGYTGYMSSVGFGGGQNYAYSPMMAQMDSSSMTTDGGQDLYINNAYMESNNMKDLFYSANETGA